MYTRKGGNKMNRITIYRDWKIVRKLDIPDEIKKEINKVLVRLLIEQIRVKFFSLEFQQVLKLITQ